MKINKNTTNDCAYYQNMANNAMYNVQELHTHSKPKFHSQIIQSFINHFIFINILSTFFN